MQVYRFVPEHIGHGAARIRFAFDRHHVRPGNTLGGPALMALADFTMYAVVLGMAGPRALAAVTSRSEEHTSELQSLMRNSYAVFCLKKKISSIQLHTQTMTTTLTRTLSLT